MLKKIFDYFFKYPFTCPDCGKKYKKYYDGNDCACGKIHLCMKCYLEDHVLHDSMA